MDELLKCYKDMLFIREFEKEVLNLFSEGKLFGTTHTCIGQEANAVGVVSNLNSDDIVVSNHRCHGTSVTQYYNWFRVNHYEWISCLYKCMILIKSSN